jgi:hypothetical protein
MVGKYGKERRTRFYLIRPSSAQAGIFYPGPVSPETGRSGQQEAGHSGGAHGACQSRKQPGHPPVPGIRILARYLAGPARKNRVVNIQSNPRHRVALDEQRFDKRTVMILGCIDFEPPVAQTR